MTVNLPDHLQESGYATCPWCEQWMDGSPCAVLLIVKVEGIRYYRELYDRGLLPSGAPGPNPRCRDCGTPEGGLHHSGCCVERCPRCLGQAIGCGCRWEGDKEDRAVNGYRPPESPQARRVET